MPEVPQWARVRGDVNFGARRGAWHEVVHLTTEAAVIQIGQRSVSIPRDYVQIVPVRPQRWSVIPRPRSTFNIPMLLTYPEPLRKRPYSVVPRKTYTLFNITHQSYQ